MIGIYEVTNYTTTPHHTTPQLFYGPFPRSTRASRCHKRTCGPYACEKYLPEQCTHHWKVYSNNILCVD